MANIDTQNEYYLGILDEHRRVSNATLTRALGLGIARALTSADHAIPPDTRLLEAATAEVHGDRIAQAVIEGREVAFPTRGWQMQQLPSGYAVKFLGNILFGAGTTFEIRTNRLQADTIGVNL